MSFTSTVPAAVPSVLYSSRPLTLVSAAKYDVPPSTVKPGGFEPAAPGLDVLEHDRAGRSAIAGPELAPVGAVVAEKSRTLPTAAKLHVEFDVAGARGDVIDQDRAVVGAVALPQLGAVDAVVGGEEHRAPDRGKAVPGIEAARRPRVDVPHDHGAAAGAVASSTARCRRRRRGCRRRRRRCRRQRRSRPAMLVPPVPGRMSFTRPVPAGVPSVLRHSLAMSASVAGNSTLSPSGMNLAGDELAGPGFTSFSSRGTGSPSAADAGGAGPVTSRPPITAPAKAMARRRSPFCGRPTSSPRPAALVAVIRTSRWCRR